MFSCPVAMVLDDPEQTLTYEGPSRISWISNLSLPGDFGLWALCATRPRRWLRTTGTMLVHLLFTTHAGAPATGSVLCPKQQDLLFLRACSVSECWGARNRIVLFAGLDHSGEARPLSMAASEANQDPFRLKVTPATAHFRARIAVGRCRGACENHESKSTAGVPM